MQRTVQKMLSQINICKHGTYLDPASKRLTLLMYHQILSAEPERHTHSRKAKLDYLHTMVKTPLLKKGTSLEPMPLAQILSLLGALPPGPLGVTSQYPLHC